MKAKFITLAIIFIISANIYSQNGVGTISGQVRETNTRLPLVAANIILLGTDLGAATDDGGNFIIKNVPSNTYQIRASIIGYRSQIKTDIVVQPGKLTQVNFDLSPETIEIENVVIRADYFNKDILQPSSIKTFSYEEIRRSPGGFEDVVRALSILPGVAQADAGRNDLIVRGGAPSENLYIVDGLEIPNINHFGTQGATGGPLSYINLDFVRETSFSTGGFSAMYGDKLSSVLKIDLRQGRNDRVGGKATISATQFGLNLEGPAFIQNSNFIFSARRSYLDFIFKAAGFAFVPEYYDVLSNMSIN
jgi:TonB-dependent Receptor Plug Domain.